MNEFSDFIEFDDKIVYNEWVKWKHFGIVDEPEWLREFIRAIAALFGHCKKCTALSGCYFAMYNKPKHPMHFDCHCFLSKISLPVADFDVTAYCDIRKVSTYIWDIDKTKGKIFKSLGYTEEDSYLIKCELERQAVKKYANGDYTLKELNNYGQTISITVEINNKKFKTGWIIKPKGLIKNTTPFCGKVDD